MKCVSGLTCHLCGKSYPAQALWVCAECLGPLEVTYDYDVARRVISRAAIEPAFPKPWTTQAWPSPTPTPYSGGTCTSSRRSFALKCCLGPSPSTTGRREGRPDENQCEKRGQHREGRFRQFGQELPIIRDILEVGSGNSTKFFRKAITDWEMQRYFEII